MTPCGVIYGLRSTTPAAALSVGVPTAIAVGTGTQNCVAILLKSLCATHIMIAATPHNGKVNGNRPTSRSVAKKLPSNAVSIQTHIGINHSLQEAKKMADYAILA